MWHRDLHRYLGFRNAVQNYAMIFFLGRSKVRERGRGGRTKRECANHRHVTWPRLSPRLPQTPSSNREHLVIMTASPTIRMKWTDSLKYMTYPKGCT